MVDLFGIKNNPPNAKMMYEHKLFFFCVLFGSPVNASTIYGALSLDINKRKEKENKVKNLLFAPLIIGTLQVYFYFCF
jgi:hypothetical protein